MDEIFNRVSIRKYKNKKIEKEKIEVLLKAAMRAPSAANGQPWEFIVVTNKDTLYKLSEISPHSQMIGAAPLAIIFLANTKNQKYPQFYQQDMAASMENLLIEVCNQGLGAVWLGIAPLEDRMQFITDMFNLSKDIKPFSIAVIGYADEDRNPDERFDSTKIHYEKY